MFGVILLTEHCADFIFAGLCRTEPNENLFAGGNEVKKENAYKLLYVACILLIIGFAVRLGMNHYKYDSINNSAPFYVLVLERTVEFIVPSIAAFIVGRLMKKKYSR